MARYVNGKALHGLSQAYHWLVSGLFGEDAADAFYTSVDSFVNKYTGKGLTNSDTQKALLEDEIADENSTVAYMRQKEFQEAYLTPEAQLKSQAAGYDALGINRMMLAGSQPGASASTAPASSGGTAGSIAGSGDLLGSLMSAIFKAKDLKLQEELGNRELDIKEREVDAQAAHNQALTENLDIQNRNLQELLDLTKVERGKNIELLAEKIKSEPVLRSLNAMKISESEAITGLYKYQGLIAKAQAERSREYWELTLRSSELLNDYQKTTNEFQRKLIMQQVDMNNQQLTGMILENGIAAKQFGYYDSDRKFSRVMQGVNAGVSALSAIGSVSLGAGGLMAGKRALFRSNFPTHQTTVSYE